MPALSENLTIVQRLGFELSSQTCAASPSGVATEGDDPFVIVDRSFRNAGESSVAGSGTQPATVPAVRYIRRIRSPRSVIQAAIADRRSLNVPFGSPANDVSTSQNSWNHRAPLPHVSPRGPSARRRWHPT